MSEHVEKPCEVVLAEFVFGPKKCCNMTKFRMLDEYGIGRAVCKECIQRARRSD